MRNLDTKTTKELRNPAYCVICLVSYRKRVLNNATLQDFSICEPSGLSYTFSISLYYFSTRQVTENTHRYLKDIEMREEGGTPAIIESVRAGLVFQLKSAVGVPRIIERDRHILRYLSHTIFHIIDMT